MPREIDCPECGGRGYTEGNDGRQYGCPDCKDDKITVYTEAELQELRDALKRIAEREGELIAKDAYTMRLIAREALK